MNFGELHATLVNADQPDERIVVEKADPLVLATVGLVADWRSDDRSPHVHYRREDEWDQAVTRALAELGLTYDELADQARRRDYTSPRHRRLWVIIGRSP